MEQVEGDQPVGDFSDPRPQLLDLARQCRKQLFEFIEVLCDQICFDGCHFVVLEVEQEPLN